MVGIVAQVGIVDPVAFGGEEIKRTRIVAEPTLVKNQYTFCVVGIGRGFDSQRW